MEYLEEKNAVIHSISAGLDYPGVVPDHFFFQAEDGIRDLYVTGVQTCALPIFDHIARLERVGEELPVVVDPGEPGADEEVVAHDLLPHALHRPELREEPVDRKSVV